MTRNLPPMVDMIVKVNMAASMLPSPLCVRQGCRALGGGRRRCGLSGLPMGERAHGQQQRTHQNSVSCPRVPIPYLSSKPRFSCCLGVYTAAFHPAAVTSVPVGASVELVPATEPTELGSYCFQW